jgi:small subunit ribosomal protein S7
MRRNRAEPRKVTPDPRYHSEVVAKFINNVMERGKKSLAASIVYKSFEIIEERTKRPGIEVFEEALKNATPLVEVRPRRVGGATYQIPMEIGPARRQALAMRWLIESARKRSGRDGCSPERRRHHQKA